MQGWWRSNLTTRCSGAFVCKISGAAPFRCKIRTRLARDRGGNSSLRIAEESLVAVPGAARSDKGLAIVRLHAHQGAVRGPARSGTKYLFGACEPVGLKHQGHCVQVSPTTRGLRSIASRERYLYPDLQNGDGMGGRWT